MRAGEVQLQTVDAFVLTGFGQRLPVMQLLVIAGAGHDRGDEHFVRERLLDPAQLPDPPIHRLVRDQLPVPGGHQRRLRAAVHGQAGTLVIRSQKLRLGTFHVDDGMETDRLGDHAPPSRLERAHDVGVGLRGRGRSEHERILEADAGKRRRQISGHGAPP